MANLNAWQKISRVLPGKPFGNGADGAYSSATIPTLVKDSCSGTATSNTLTTTGSTFANGDILLIHQTRGTGAGQWEINKVASGGGSTSLTLSKPLHYTYTDSGASQAQAVKIPQYTTLELPSGTWTIPAWDGNVGGIFVAAAKISTTISAEFNGSGKGFLGGTGGLYNAGNTSGKQGDGSSGSGSQTYSANGNGGGGGGETSDNPAGWTGRGGGGGAGGVGGSTSPTGASNANNGVGGSVVVSTDLITLLPGGGGGGGSGDRVANTGSADGGNGGAGGGTIVIFSMSIDVSSATITLNGANGGNRVTHNDDGNSKGGGGGGGGGGSALFVGKDVVLGTNKITVTAGTGGGGADSNNGGAGGVGRIAVHHSGLVTGTTTPTFTDVTDTSLKEVSSGMFMVL